MAKFQVLPLELQNLIFKELSKHPRTLNACALVCKHWLLQSRRHSLSIRKIELHVKPSNKREEVLQQMLLNSEPDCSFWPHIKDLTFRDSYTGGGCESCIRLILKSLSHASGLQLLQLKSIALPALPKDTFPKNNIILSLNLKNVKFPSPAQLFYLLASLQNLHSELNLQDPD